jgi:hypothetical protein
LQSKAFDNLFELRRNDAPPAAILSPLTRQGHQTEQPVLRNPALRGSIWNACRMRHRLQRLVLLQVRLDQPKPIKREFPGLFRQPGKLVHT